MSVKIFKYHVIESQFTSVYMPEGAQILKWGDQNGQITLWAAVDEFAPYTYYNLQIVPTGGEMPDADYEYLDTIQMDNGLVWHIFLAGITP